MSCGPSFAESRPICPSFVKALQVMSKTSGDQSFEYGMKNDFGRNPIRFMHVL